MKKSSVVVVKINMTRISRRFIFFVHYCTFTEEILELVSFCEIFDVSFC